MSTRSSIESIAQAFGTGGFTPHGYCLAWDPWLLALSLFGNAMIAVAYLAFPLQIMYVFFHARRHDASVILNTHNYSMRLFATFIFCCGIIHAFDIFELWYPQVYWAKALWGVLTGLVSLLAALMLGFLVKIDYTRAASAPSNSII